MIVKRVIVIVVMFIVIFVATGCAASQSNVSRFADIQTGDVISFGKYEQDGDGWNGQEDIEWKVLKIENDKALIVSNYVLDCQPYNTTWTVVTWESCSLRKWLNESFYFEAFSESERNSILETTVINKEYPQSGAKAGNTTKDKVFALSVEEVQTLFYSSATTRTTGTAYAESKGLFVFNGKAGWWLRTPGGGYGVSSSAAGASNASYVRRDGTVDWLSVDFGHGTDREFIGVRPALWISLE